MQRVQPLDELTPADLWREAPESKDEFWQDTREKQVRLLKALLEGTLEEEMTVLLGAGRFRRLEGRRGYRNGFYERDLATQIGIVTAIRVPRARDSVGERSIFSRYQRWKGLLRSRGGQVRRPVRASASRLAVATPKHSPEPTKRIAPSRQQWLTVTPRIVSWSVASPNSCRQRSRHS